MLYVISKGSVEGYDQGQQPVVYLESSTETVVAAGLGYVFTDGNAATEGLTVFSADVDDLDRMVDWELMTKNMWNNTARRSRPAAAAVCRVPCPRWLAVRPRHQHHRHDSWNPHRGSG